MKKTLSFFLAVLMVITALPLTAITSFADVGEDYYEYLYSGDYVYFIVSEEEKTCEIAGYTGTATELVIPEEIDGYSVISIGGFVTMWSEYEGAFSYCESLISVTIPDSVTSIGDDAFFGCISLESITIPDSVTSIGIGAFGYTAYYNDETNWENDVLYIGNHLIEAKDTISGDYVIKDGTKTIANFTFEDCTSLTSIIIPDSVTSIGRYAFRGCTSLESINVLEGNTVYSSVDGVLFNKEKTKLIQYPIGNTRTAYTIPNSVTSIDWWAFYYCTSLTSITIPDSVISIGYAAFYNTAYYNDATNWENDVLYIGNHLIEAKDTISGDYAIKDGTKTIAAYAFGYGYSLTSVTIPDSVTSIGYRAFSADNLTDIYYTGTEKQWNEIIIEYGNDYLTSATIHYNYKGSDYSGWIQESGKWAYYKNGKVVKNSWAKDSKGWCYLDSDGYMATNKWIKDSVGWCYVGGNGYCVTNTWKKDSHGWCYLDSNGRMATNKWIKDSVGWCYVGADGYCVTNTWKKDSHGWCYLDSNGRMATNKWIKDSVGWCYVGADGYCVTNQWKADSKGWCYLDANGRMMTNSWLQWNGNWYYLDENGYMVTGTKVINGKTYKFNSNGVWIG